MGYMVTIRPCRGDDQWTPLHAHASGAVPPGASAHLNLNPDPYVISGSRSFNHLELYGTHWRTS